MLRLPHEADPRQVLRLLLLWIGTVPPAPPRQSPALAL